MSAPLGQLAQLITSHSGQPLPTEVREAARRTLYNVLATAVGASREPAVDVVAAVSAGLTEGKGAVPGRAGTLAPLDAAFATGLAAHLDDYDDTHLSTVIHPGAVCLAVLVGLQDELADADADEVLTAYAWGVEAQLRLGVAVSPEHYDAGWHITGTCGAAGAAVTAALLLGLDTAQLRVALEWAVEGGLGNREGFGSMTKPWHPGKAAVVALRAVRDAAAGLPGPGDTLTGPAGFAARLAGGKFAADAVLGEPGVRWELLENTFKPYPCGIVTHPAIEAAEALHAPLAEHGGAASVAAIRLRCHPLVPELTGNLAPVDGLQARFSTAHGVAAGLLLPTVDLSGYATEFVVSDQARRLRSLVTFDATPDCARDAAHLEVTLADGTVLSHDVLHAKGSLGRPLTSEELTGKAEGLVGRLLPGGAAALDAATRQHGTGYVRGLLAACTPEQAERPAVVGLAAEPGDDSEDHALARWLAEARETTAEASALAEEATRVRAEVSETGERERAGAVAARLVAAGHGPAAAAAAAAGDAGAVSTALAVGARVADRLGVPADRLPTLTATIAAVHGAPARAVLAALGLAATQTTTVTGTEQGRELDAVRARHAAEDGVEAAALARAGFTGPAHPLTGRRALLSLLALSAEPALA
ncbi:MmgE/PrpD family protein [Prauserella cavernicola]|uniref:MmgE/PrpD family protein n=1 Tax=Prauserella cavernicola TaxID=2800127 RepID=A0A934QUX3_9PSEU|nr:MmgE/PrpD family protein [Prauserella cavernicola]MBK1786781.1 MmgE/PrpD family protein [Prauserella cavernicola]